MDLTEIRDSGEMSYRLFPIRLLACLLALSLAAIVADAPALKRAYTAAPGPAWAWARTAVDPKAHALAHAWAAIRDEDGRAATRWAVNSLSHGRMNGYGWLALAWARAQEGDAPNARAALAQSYALAPTSMPLAQSRTALAQRWWPEMDSAERHRLLKEVRVARGLDAAAFNRLAEDVPRLAILHQMAAP